MSPGTPPDSQGIAWLMQANMLAAHDLTAMAVDSAEFIHRLVEAKKLVFGYRDAYVCDPLVHPVPLDRTLSPTLTRDCVNRIDPGRAAPALRPGVSRRAVTTPSASPWSMPTATAWS